MWIEGYTRIDLGPDGGFYDDTSHPKGGLHTTEGTTLAGAEAAFAAYPPHIGYDPIRRIKHQYIRLDKCSYAYKGSENDDEYIIQVEIVGFASQAHTWGVQTYKNIAEDVFKPLEELIGIPRTSLRFYRADEGIVLASPNSPIRLNATELRTYSGWLGHQHIPAPDAHWDPGGFLIQKCFDYLGMLDPVVTEEDEGVKTFYVKGDGPDPWGKAIFCVSSDGDRVYRRHVSPAEWAIASKRETLLQVKQVDIDAIPWGIQAGLEPWKTR